MVDGTSGKVALMMGVKQPAVERGSMLGEPPPLANFPITTHKLKLSEVTNPVAAP